MLIVKVVIVNKVVLFIKVTYVNIDIERFICLFWLMERLVFIIDYYNRKKALPK